jgi:heme-degrading monooxygenase HmoA
MIVTVFRSRLMPGVKDEYVALADRMNELARTMPGYISHKGFFAEDGERVTIVEFESEEGMTAWRTHPEHIKAQRLARQVYYAEYHLQICELTRDSHYRREDPTAVA